MHLHAYVLPISSYTLSKSNIECNVLCQFVLVLEIETLTETILHA
jgi:hypothetical protein